MRPLLALDLSLTSTGVAWRTADGTIDTRVIRTEPGENPSGYRKRRDGEHVCVGDENWRMRWIAGVIVEKREDFIAGVIAEKREDFINEKELPGVFAESVPTRNARSIVTLAKLHGHVAHALGFDPAYVDPATVKKHITGHGDASKREVRDAVFCFYGYDERCVPYDRLTAATDDEIDALAVLAWAIDQEGNHA